MSDEDKVVQEQDENAQVEETTEKTEVAQEETQEQEQGESKEGSDESTEQKERPVYTMPVSKAQEEKRRAVEKAREEAKQEAEAEMQKLKAEYEEKLRSSNPSADAYNEKLRAVAEKHGLKTEAAADLLGVFKEITTPDMSKYDQLIKQQEMQTHKSKASDEFDSQVLPLIQKDFPNASQEHIQKVKREIVDLAFSQKYHTYDLTDIYKVRKDEYEYKDSPSAEASGGRGSEIVSFDKLSDKEEHELAERDPQKFAEYLKQMRKTASRYID